MLSWDPFSLASSTSRIRSVTLSEGELRKIVKKLPTVSGLGQNLWIKVPALPATPHTAQGRDWGHRATSWATPEMVA